MKQLMIVLFMLVLVVPYSAICQHPWSSIGVLVFKENPNYNSVELFDTELLTEGKDYYELHSKQLPYRIEYADEMYGIGISEMYGDTIKLIVSNKMGDPQYMWTILDTAIMDCILWMDYIPQQKCVFFTDTNESSLRFFYSPNGKPKQIALPDVREKVYMYENTIWLVKDFDMVPTGYTSAGGWLQVDVSVPHDEGEDDFECTRVRAWIKYIDKDVRPLVWFHTRD